MIRKRGINITGKKEIGNMKDGRLQKDSRDKDLIDHDNHFSCQRCGKCCRGGWHEKSLHITYDDLKKWRDLGRDDILQYCEIRLVDDKQINGIHWNGQPILGCNMFDEHSPRVCPFLQKVDNKDIYKCGIQDVKPEVCRDYPRNTPSKMCRRMIDEMWDRLELKWKQKINTSNGDMS